MWAEQFCQLFNEPIEYLKNYCSSSAWPEVANNPQAQARFADTIRKDGETLKQCVIAAEQFYEIRTKYTGGHWHQRARRWEERLKHIKDLAQQKEVQNDLLRTDAAYQALKAFQKACENVNKLTQVDGKILAHLSASLSIRNDGEIGYSVALIQADQTLIEKYFPAWYDAVGRLESFKSHLALEKEHFPIGVCRYEKCRKFFVKKRKDERYCSPTHANTAAVRRKRERERRKRHKSSL